MIAKKNPGKGFITEFLVSLIWQDDSTLPGFYGIIVPSGRSHMLLAFLYWKNMADFQVTDKTLLTSVDRAADSFLVYDASATALKRTTVNNALDLTSHPVGIDDAQTLTLKTLTAPAISSPVLSGTVTGTYTFGGTPTFPAAVVTLTGSQTLTNKTLTSPAINTPTINNPTLNTDAISEFTGAAGVTIDGVLLKDSKMNGSYITDSTVGNSQLALGVPVQMVSTSYTAVATGTTTIPLDDTIPQNTEGTEFITQAITPKSSTNILVIEDVIVCAANANVHLIQALFQDSTANALAASIMYQAVANQLMTITLRHTMVAGTTSATTFKVRAGASSAATFTINGSNTARFFGAITKSSIVITEYKAA